MPCDTVVKVEVENTEWTKLARKKLGLPLTGRVEQYQADEINIEAGKLKAEASILEQDPFAIIEGMEVGSNELNITINIGE